MVMRNSDRAYDQFADWLNQSGDKARVSLSELPGFVGADQAVSREMSKRDVLKRMDSSRADSLPVIDDEGKFVGTVDRSQLTASLILDVVNRLDGDTADNDKP